VKSKHAAAELLAVGARHPDRELSDRLFLTVATIGPEAADLLAPYLQADRIETRRRAALALSRLGSDAVVAVPALCETLEDEAVIVRFWAAKTLGNIGSEARQATGALLGLFGDADPNVRWEAITAIAKIAPGAITEDDWSRLLADSDPGVRQRAATIRTAGL
jgi:HEAT repeat protein